MTGTLQRPTPSHIFLPDVQLLRLVKTFDFAHNMHLYNSILVSNSFVFIAWR